MAQAVVPATDGALKLTKAQAALIQAEKQKDNETRARLEKLYGAAQGRCLRRVHLTRFADKAWKCPACGAMSRDIRYVCGQCMTPEPGALSRERPYKEKSSRAVEDAAKSGVQLPPPQWLDPQSSSQSGDKGVTLLRMQTTQRVYRQFMDPVAPAAKMAKKGAQGHVDPAVDYDDVDEEAREERVYNDVPEGCAPGARFREMADPRRGDEIDEGQDDEEENIGVIGDARPQGNPRSTQAQPRIMPERPFTHFLSLPIGKLSTAKVPCEALIDRLHSFTRSHTRTEANDATGADSAAASTSPSSATPSPAGALSEDMISPVTKLHMTMLLLTLSTPEDVAFAVELLEHFKKIWDEKKRTLSLSLASGAGPSMHATSEAAKMTLAQKAPHRPLIAFGEGLHVMPTGKSNDVVDPKKASVVYMSLRDESSRAAVTTIQDLLHTCFREIIDRPDEAEKSKQLLHMTVVNKKWQRTAAKRPFDATALLEAFRDAAIGQGKDDGLVELGAVELNRLSGGNRDDGYFVEASVEL